MLLQLALDRPESLAVVQTVAKLVDILEIGTPLLKRYGLSVISTVRELAPGVPILADSKTVDAGAAEAEMLFASGARFVTVLSCASPATQRSAADVASRHGGWLVIDTLTDRDGFVGSVVDHERLGYVSLHVSTDARLAGDASLADRLGSMRDIRAMGYRVSLAGGISEHTLAAVVEAAPDVVVIGSAITDSADPRRTAQWIRQQLPDRTLGWP